MIFGIGVDQVDLNRVRKLLDKSRTKFEKRCFTDSEIIYANRFADPSKRLGARFAGKEAVMKSLGKGWRQVNWKDIEITGGGEELGPCVAIGGGNPPLAGLINCAVDCCRDIGGEGIC